MHKHLVSIHDVCNYVWVIKTPPDHHPTHPNTTMTQMRKEFSSAKIKQIMSFTINGKPVVEEVWYETDFGDLSAWVGLKDGFNWNGCSFVHENNFDDVMKELQNVTEGETY
jgi:hypothetical protein